MTQPSLIKTMAVYGVGLIGGSLAAAAREAGIVHKVIGVGRDQVRLQKAIELNLIDEYTVSVKEAVEAANVIVLAVPVGALPEVFAGIAPHLRKGKVVTDVGSVKGEVIDMARKHLGEHMSLFVPGHPIAGSEQSGAAASDPELFNKRYTILTPVHETDMEALALIRTLWEATGAWVVEQTSEDHDNILAACSHLPHILAYSLVDMMAQSEQGESAFEFAAGGFRDFTRIASSDPVMWRDVCLTNKDPIIRQIDNFGSALQALRKAVADHDSDAIFNIFNRAKIVRDRIIREKDAGK